MFRSLQHFISIGLILVLSGLPFSAPLAQAQDESSLEDRQACGDKLLSFVSSFLSTDGAKEYWTDYLVRNRCQQEDIFALEAQLDSLMDELYDSDCTTSEFTEIQNEIREVRMELHFVRHVVPADEDTFFEGDLGAFDFDVVQESLFDEMVERYTRDKSPAWTTEEELTELFAYWLERYEDRIELYQSCNVSPWQEVTDRSKELLDTLEEIKNLFSAENIKETAAPIQEEFHESRQARQEEYGIRENGEIAAPWSAVKGFLKKHITIELAKLPPRDRLDDIAEEAEALGDLLSFDDAQELLNESQTDFDRSSSKAEMVGRYTLLYKNGGTEATLNLVDKVEELQSIIRRSTGSQANGAHLHALQLAVKGINKKQGSGQP